jgi:tetratricopeptide (TPR) repeat protein
VLKSRVCFLLCFFFIFTAGLNVSASSPSVPQPLTASEIVALQVGGALPGNIAHDIKVRGLSFHPDESFLVVLKQAGADSVLLTAVSNAHSSASTDTQQDPELLRHLLRTADLLKSNRLDDAEAELSTALSTSFAAPETGFVMADVLRQKQHYEQAASVYSVLIRKWPDFPELHTKASYILYRLGDSEDAFSEARKAVALNPDDAEAHKNAGLALDDERKFDAAAAEYQQALRIKPDYGVVHYDLGLLFFHTKSYDRSIAEYKKAIVLDPNDADQHSALGLAYQQVNDLTNAIAEQREAQRLKPDDPDIRQNLAAALMKSDPMAAIAELKETERLYPDRVMCHICLGNALVWAGDIKGAQTEYAKAENADPTAFEPHTGLGKIEEQQKNYNGALEEYRQAERLAPDEAHTHEDVGRVLLAKQDFSEAAAELKNAVGMLPSSWEIHDMYGKALEGEGQTDFAITEFKESIALDPKQPQVMIELGAAFEKKGDWAAAMEQYKNACTARRAILTKAQRGEIVRWDGPDAEVEYGKALHRFADHVARLNAAGKQREAAELEKQVQTVGTADKLSQDVQTAMMDGGQALRDKRYSDAEKSYQHAADLAAKLPVSDPSLLGALNGLANAYAFSQDYSEANQIAHHEIELIEKQYGPAAPETVKVLYFLGGVSMRKHDLMSAQAYFSRALAINTHHFGENDGRTSESLRAMAGFYMMQQDWPHAEALLLRAVSATEASSGPDNGFVIVPLWGLCSLYDTWGRPEKSQPCWHRAATIAEREPEDNRGDLAPALQNEAAALRKLGRNSEAGQVELRLSQLHSVASSK